MKAILICLSVLAAFVPHAHADEDVYGKNVGSYYMGATKFNVNQIPGWQTKIYDKLGIPFETRIMMRVANQLECGDPDGFCLGLNAADSGPFQINRIHREEYAYSSKLVRAGQREREKSKLSGNWKDTVRLRDELFEFQARWTWDRMRRLAIQYERKVSYSSLDRERQVWYQAVWHNGNVKIKNGRQFRFFYGDKAVKHWRILRASYSKQSFSLAGQVSDRNADGSEAVKSPAQTAQLNNQSPVDDGETPWFPELESATPVPTKSEAGVSFSFP